MTTENMTTEHALQVPCCPEFPADPACDVLDFHYRLRYPTQVTNRDRRVVVSVSGIVGRSARLAVAGIVGSQSVGHHASDSAGFCLEEQ